MVPVSLRERRDALIAQRDLGGEAFCRAYALAADEWVSGVADAACGGNRRHLALVAVGGYGRGLLFPFSDLDLVLVHGGRGDVSKIADLIWYPVWDQGVHLDHSVRRPREVLEMASTDMRVALGLLDARVVWGDTTVAEPMIAKSLANWQNHLGAQWLDTMSEQMSKRHAAEGEVAFLLEPDLKEGHGGLRDVNMLDAMARYSPLMADYVDLGTVHRSSDQLTTVRVELHRATGRPQETLLLQDQDQVAARVGVGDADELMQIVAKAGRRIAWATDEAWRRRQFWDTQAAAPPRRFGRRAQTSSEPEPTVRELEPGIVLVRGEISLSADADLGRHPAIAFQLAAVAAKQNRPIALGALFRMEEQLAPLPNPWPEAAREALIRTLLTGRPAIAALESLDHRGLLSRLLPEWQAVRYKPQRNAYHRFTVDRHLLEAAANAAQLAEQVSRPDLLVIGTLLHDIGKGYPGDHTDVGIIMVADIGRRMGFGPDDVETLVTCVRLHLLLPDTAMRRDLDDPRTIENVAAQVGTRDRLELLHALTVADSLATGSSAWGPWKAGLVADLVAKTAKYIDGTNGIHASDLPDPHRELMNQAREQQAILVDVDLPFVVVTGPDQPGLLAAAAGALALHGCNVLSADVSSENAIALDVFVIESVVGDALEPQSFLAHIREALDQRLDLNQRLSDRSAAYSRNRRPASAQPFAPEVLIHNDASAESTVIEVKGQDEIGLLYRLTRTLLELECDVMAARVATLGGDIVDSFYVRGRDGHKLNGGPSLDLVRERLEAALQAQ